MVAGALVSGATGGKVGYLAQFLAAERAGRPFDPVTVFNPRTSMAEAYELQKRYVRQRVRGGERIAGYKGGLMSPASLKARGVSEPLVGVLFASGRAGDGATISLCGYRKASFELKLGYLLGDLHAGGSPASSVLPVIDLPDIAYRNPDHYSAIDMVAANVSSARYVRGTSRPPAELDLDSLKVTLSRDGQPVAGGFGRETLGGQRESLTIALTQIRKSGRRPKGDDLVITGKMGDRGWLLPGRYVADYGPLGQLRFTVAPCRS